MFMITPVLPVYSIYSSEKKTKKTMKGLRGLLRIDTGGCSVIRATPFFFMILLICTHQLKSNFLLS